MTFNDYLRGLWSAITGKAMSDLHPEFTEREHIASVASDAIMPAGYSYLAALGDYESSVWVRKAVKVIAENFAPLPVVILRDEKEQPTHPLAVLLTDMNPAQSSAEIWYQWAVDMLIGGEEGWELVKDARGNYVEIWARQPHTITVLPDLARKRYFVAAGYTIDDQLGQGYTLPADELLFFKFFNPRNVWRGLAPITAVRSAILIDQYAQAWARLFFRKNARPDFAVIAPEGVTATERDELELKLAAKFRGADNWFRPIILEQGVTDIKPLDFKPRDLEWIEQRKLSREEIGAIFGVPDEIMGWGRDTYENFETAHRVLWSLTLLPLAGLRDIALTEFFRRVGVLKPNERVATDTSQIAALKTDQSQKIAQVQALWAMGVPFNAASAHVGLGLVVDGGDVGYLPLNLAPRAAGTGPKQVRAPRAKQVTTFGSPEHRAVWEQFVKRTAPFERRFGRIVANLLREQARAVLVNLRRGAKDAQKDAASAAANPFDLEEWIREFRDAVKPVLSDAMDAAGNAALADAGIGIAFDVLEPAVIEFLNERTQRFAEQVNETTWEQLKASLTAGLDAGESIPALAARVQNVMGDRIRSSAETIARTEIIGASNAGSLLAWQQNGDLIESKQWIATFDDRVRDAHADAHGQTVPLNDSFDVGGEALQFPGDGAGSAGNVINCRCTMVAVLAKTKQAAPAPPNGRLQKALGNA